mgnify:CR=1 FL=1
MIEGTLKSGSSLLDMKVLILFLFLFVSFDQGSAVFRYFLVLILFLHFFFPRKNIKSPVSRFSFSSIFVLATIMGAGIPLLSFQRVAVNSLLGVSKLKI